MCTMSRYDEHESKGEREFRRMVINCILVNAPLSRDFQVALTTVIGPEVSFLSVPELRRLPAHKVFAKLSKLDADALFIPIEDESTLTILPVLKLLAGMSNVRRIEVIYPDLRRRRLSRLKALLPSVSLANCSITIRRAAARSKREMDQLMMSSRVEAIASAWNSVFYIDADLNFGVKAEASSDPIAGLINELRSQGFMVVYASTTVNENIRQDVIPLPLMLPSSYGLPHDYNYYRFNQLVIKQLLPRLKTGGFSFIYQRMSLANYAGVVLSRAHKIPLVLEYNGSEARAAGKWGDSLSNPEMALKAEDVCLRHAHLVVTVSEALRDELVERGVEPTRALLHPNCIDPAAFDSLLHRHRGEAVRKELAIPTDAIVISFLAFGQWHGAEILAQAFRHLVDKDRDWLVEKKVHFLFIGDGLGIPKLKEILADANCKQFCHFTGAVFQQEVPEFLAASDILVYSHVLDADGGRSSGCETKLLEYMAMNKAIIAAELGQIGQILTSNIRASALVAGDPRQQESSLAVLFSPGDIGELSAGIKFLVEHPNWRSTLGNNARKEVLRKYTWRHHVNSIKRSLHQLGYGAGLLAHIQAETELKA